MSLATGQQVLLDVDAWETLASELNQTDLDEERARQRPRGVQARLIVPAMTADGRPSQVVVETILTDDDELVIGIRTGHDGERVLMLGTGAAREHVHLVEFACAEVLRHEQARTS